MFELLPVIDFIAVAQAGNPVPDTGVGGVTSVLGSAVAAFLTTLIVGAILIALAPTYTAARMEDVLEAPLGAFLYGVVCLFLLILVIIILVITILGIPFAILLGLLAYLIWAVGAAIAFLAIGDRLVGRRDGWTKPLLVGAAINGGLTLTGIGGILTFAIGAAGFGTVLREYL